MADTLRLLIVDVDEAGAARMIRSLTEAGHTLDWRRVDGPDPMRAALEAGRWDAVIADGDSRWPSGQSPIDILRTMGLDLPLIATSRRPGRDLAADLLRAGAHDFVARERLELLPEALRREIREAHVRAQRRRGEDVLRQSEERYRRLFEGSNDAIFVVEKRTGRYLDANRAAERLTGRTVHELRKLTTVDVTPRGAEARIKSLQTAEGAPEQGEVEYVRPDGSSRTALLSVVHIDDQLAYGIAHDITARKRAENALRALLDGTTVVGEAFFPALVRELASAIGASDVLVGQVCGPACDRIRTVAVWADDTLAPNFEYAFDGTPCAHVIGGSVCFYPSGVAALFPRDAALTRRGIEAYLGVPLRGVDGSPAGHLVALARRPFPDPSLAESLMRIFAARVEAELERMKSAGALRRSEEELRSIFLAAPAGIAVVSDRRIVSANERMHAITGYPVAEQLGRLTRFLYDSDDEFARVGREVASQGAGSGVGTAEARWRRKDGGIVHVLLSWAPIDPADRTRGATFAVLDITERRLAEDRLRRLAAAIEQSEEGVMITDPDGTIEYVNPAFQRITGHSPLEAIGQHSRLLKSGKQDQAFYERLWDTIVSGRTWTGRFVNRRKDGTHYFEDCTISPVFGSDGRIERFVAAKRDVTKAIRMEEELRQAQRVESVGRLAAGVAHDFNNLLSPILGYAELLLGELHPSDERYGQIHEIEEAAKRARDLTRQLLAFGRKQTLQIKPVDLNGIVGGMERLIRRTLREDVELTMVSAPEPCVVKADTGQAEQVLMNLVVNAQDAMPGGGRLVVRVSRATLRPEDCADRPGSAPGEYGVLMVGDTGTGMDAAVRERIFEPFFSTKGERGTGLGLSTVYGIVTQHGGHVWVDSEPGRGSLFQVFLPAAAAPAAADAGVAAGSGSTPGGASGTVLLVEDNEGVRQLARTVLRREGYTVLSAASGDEALALLEAHGDRVDVLLTDVIMTGIDGRELYRRVAERCPRVKAVFMSGYTDDVIANRGVLEEGLHFIQKPFSVTALTLKLREVLGT
jgi:PAS domain S-box-containing protein